MRAGELDQSVKLLRQDVGVSATGSGAELETWILVARVNARVRPVRGTETVVASTRFAEATHQFRMRFRSTLLPTWRLEWRGEQYDIVEILPGGQRLREYVDILASASPAENPNN